MVCFRLTFVVNTAHSAVLHLDATAAAALFHFLAGTHLAHWPRDKTAKLLMMSNTYRDPNASHASASAPATATVLADISEDESDDLDADSLYPESDKENDSDKQTRGNILPSYKDFSKSKERRLQYALFPLPPSSSNSSHGHGTSSPGPSHHHYQHHLQSPNDYYPCTSSARTTRSSTPVSPAFSPHEPPRIPLPQLPNTPSPVLLLPRSREGTSYFQLRRHDNISNTNTSNTASSTDSRERLGTLQEIIINTRSPKSSDDTLSHSPILPYLRKEEGEPADSKARSRTSTIRPFEEKLSLPPSPLHFHEFILDQEEPPLASSSSFTSQQAQATPSLALSPALPIEPARTVYPALKQEQWAEERPLPPPKSPSTSSLQQFDEMLSVALEAANKVSANNDEQQVSSVKELSSAITSRTGSLYGASTSSDEDLPTMEADLAGASWEDDKIWSRKSSNAAFTLESYAIRQKPFFQKKQSKIIFDDCSSSDEE